MTSKTDASSSRQEGDYPSFPTQVGRYLTSEILIDVLLGHSFFQIKGLKSCSNITRDRDEGRELFQYAELQVLERECEGPLMSMTDDRPASARAAGILDADGFLWWFYLFAKRLARGEWSKKKRRRELLPIDDNPVEELPVAANGVTPEEQLQFTEFLEQTSRLPEKKRLVVDYWLAGYSTRETSDMLKAAGFRRCSHVAVQTWLSAALEEFRSGRAAQVKKTQRKAS